MSVRASTNLNQFKRPIYLKKKKLSRKCPGAQGMEMICEWFYWIDKSAFKSITFIQLIDKIVTTALCHSNENKLLHRQYSNTNRSSKLIISRQLNEMIVECLLSVGNIFLFLYPNRDDGATRKKENATWNEKKERRMLKVEIMY